MKEITYTKTFSKNYKKITRSNPNLKIRIEKRISLFIKNKTHPTLRNHQLKGVMKDYRAFSITGDVRILFKEYEDLIIFTDIGTHNQVY